MAVLKIKDSGGNWQTQGGVGVFGNSGGAWTLIDETTLDADAAYYFKNGFSYTDILVNIVHTTGNYGSSSNKFYFRFSDSASASDTQGTFKVRINSPSKSWMKYACCQCSKISNNLYSGVVSSDGNDMSAANFGCFAPTQNAQPMQVESIGAVKIQMETGNLLSGTKIQLYGR